MNDHPDLPPLIRAWIAQLCSERFLERMERAGGFYDKVDVTLHGTKGKTIDTMPPGIFLHTG